MRGELARLYFDEIADVHFLGEARARAKACIRPDAATRADLGSVEMAERKDLGALAQRDVAQHAVRSDAHAVAEPHPTFEKAVHVDRHVAPAFELAAHVDARRIGKAHARFHQALRLAALIGALKQCELALRIDSRDFHRIVDLDADDAHALVHGERDDVGEVVLLLRILGADLAEPAGEALAVQRHEAGVDFANGALGVRRILLFDDALDVAIGAAHDAAIPLRISHFSRHHCEPAFAGLDQALQVLRRDERHIAVQDQDVAVAARVLHRLLHRVSGAELLGLQHPLHWRIGECGAHFLGAMAVNHQSLLWLERLRSVKHVREQRSATDGMQHFGQVGPHALALTRGKHYDLEGHRRNSRLILFS